MNEIKFSQFQNTKIKITGSFDPNIQVLSTSFLKFILDKAEAQLIKFQGLSKRQLEKIETDYKKYENRLNESFLMRMEMANINKRNGV